MIQRLQTLYFAAIIIICASLCSGAIIKVVQPLSDGSQGSYSLNVFYYTTNEYNQPTSNLQIELIALASIIIGLATVCIFSYKDRMKQIKLAKTNYLMFTLLILAVYGKAAMLIPDFSLAKVFPYSMFGLVMMLFMFYLNWRAIRLIKKDEDLVKSADRIR
jgi:hypothetical protein